MHFLVDFRHAFHERIPIGLGGFPAAAETHHAHGFRRFDAHRGQNMRRLFLAGRAGRTGANGKTRLVETHDPLMLAVAIRHQRGNGVPQARHIRAEDGRAGQCAQQFAFKIIAPHAAQQMLAVRNLFLAHFQRGHHRGDDRDVFRSRAPAAFLFAAVEQRRDVLCDAEFSKSPRRAARRICAPRR